MPNAVPGLVPDHAGLGARGWAWEVWPHAGADLLLIRFVHPAHLAVIMVNERVISAPIANGGQKSTYVCYVAIPQQAAVQVERRRYLTGGHYAWEYAVLLGDAARPPAGAGAERVSGAWVRLLPETASGAGSYAYEPPQGASQPDVPGVRDVQALEAARGARGQLERGAAQLAGAAAGQQAGAAGSTSVPDARTGAGLARLASKPARAAGSRDCPHLSPGLRCQCWKRQLDLLASAAAAFPELDPRAQSVLWRGGWHSRAAVSLTPDAELLGTRLIGKSVLRQVRAVYPYVGPPPDVPTYRPGAA